MNKLTLNIDTPVTINTNINLSELASVLQNFTQSYLYVSNNRLYSIESIDQLQPNHRMVGYDGGFKLVNGDGSEIICFKKELADYLNRHEFTHNNDCLPPAFFNGNLSNDPVKISIHSTPDLSPVGIVDNIQNKFLGKVPREDPRKEYQRLFDNLCNNNHNNIVGFGDDTEVITKTITSDEINALKSKFETNLTLNSDKLKSSKEKPKTEKIKPKTRKKRTRKTRENKTRENKTIENKTNKKEQDIVLPYTPELETNDIGAQSRKNGTASLVAAIRQKRSNKGKGNKDQDNKGKPNKEQKICGLPVTSPKNRSSDNISFSTISSIINAFDNNISDNNISDNNTSDNNTSDEPTTNSPVKLPIIPRNYVDRVSFNDLESNLQNAISNIVLNMMETSSPICNLVYDGVTFNITVDQNNIVSVYDIDNKTDLNRLKPEDSTKHNPTELPIAQFTVHNAYYTVSCVEHVKNYYDISPGNINFNKFNKLNDIYDLTESSILNTFDMLFKFYNKVTLVSKKLDWSDCFNVKIIYFKDRHSKSDPKITFRSNISEYHSIDYKRSKI